MSSTTVASRAYAVVPAKRSRWSRGGAYRPRSAPAAGSARHRADAGRRDRARAQPRPTTCIVPEVVSAWLSCSRRAEHSTPLASSAGPAACPGLALVVMSLQELAYQLLAPPVQFPFEFALAHLPGFVGGEEGFGIREDSIGRCARGRAREIDARDAGSRLWHVESTSLESCRHSHHRSVPCPWNRTRTPRECPEGSAPEGDRPTVFGTVSRLGWAPERRGYALAWLLSPRTEHWRDASAGKKAHE